ncbi:MAG: UDP-2,3-diacylglucosamine diphosphatase LpxI [Hyphomicrobiaceae bacterium]
MTAHATGSPIGILAGGGLFPGAVAREIVAAGRSVHLIGIEGEADAAIEAFPHSWVKWGEIGKLLDELKKAGARELVIIGSVTRPDMSKVRFDLGAILNLPIVLGLMVGGDDSVLSSVVRFFEAKGLTVRGAHDVAPRLVLGEGLVGRHAPSGEDRKDIDKGFAVVRALGALDVGQAAVVTRGHIIAVEAAEGTDRMLMRAADLRQWGKGRGRKRLGVLVKRPKPRQEMRVDMPAVGARTIELAAAAGLAGVALMADGVITAEREAIARLADENGLFVAGIRDVAE